MIFFKRKKKKKEKAEKEEQEEQEEREEPHSPKEVVRPEKKSETGALPVQKGRGAWRILKEPHITEKATDLAEKNQYIFKVYPSANKTEIKKAIEGLYGVDVLGVRLIRVKPKRRRLGRIEGWRKGYKKAMVKIREGQKIEVLPR